MTPQEAVLTSMVFHSLLYGIYVVLFVGSVCLPLSRKDRPPRKGLMAVTFTLFALITTDWILQVMIVCEQFTDGPPTLNATKNTVKSALFILTTCICDTVMSYRMFVVWNRNKHITIIPAFLLVVLFAFGIIFVYTSDQFIRIFAHGTQSELIVPHWYTLNWALYIFILSLATNFYIMAVVSYRILTVQSRLPQHVKIIGRSLGFILEIILESAGLYTLFLMVTLSGYISKQTYMLITLDATSPCMGISLSLIVVRAGLQLATPSNPVALTAIPKATISGHLINSTADTDFLQVAVENETFSSFDSNPTSESQHYRKADDLENGYGNQETDERESEKSRAL